MRWVVTSRGAPSISFTSARAIRTFASVRTILASGLVLLTATIAWAQEQDQKLLDRILKPNAALQNNVETKQFVAGGEVLTKRVQTKPFWMPRRMWEKKYAGVKEVRTKEFGTATSRFASKEANTTPRNKLTNVDKPIATTAYVTRDTGDIGKTVNTTDYAGVRPFLVRGKAQGALDAQNRSLTIEEVRELLNKNK